MKNLPVISLRISHKDNKKRMTDAKGRVILSNDFMVWSKTVNDYFCGDCGDYGYFAAVLTLDTRSSENEVRAICPWCLETQWFQDYWQIKGAYFTETKSDVNHHSKIYVISLGKVEKDGITYNKYKTKIKRHNPKL